jgi:D-alanyl-lipoteichoic acid acyltransferase DltB (MBOAT superfamily)
MAAYLLDCYWQIAEPYSNPLRLALYCIYFPLMTSGPICRKDQIGESLFAEHRFDYDRVKFGLYRIAWGLLKKLAISNRLAVIVDQMWDAPETSTGLNVWIAAGLFVIQLYTDFSGCMDIALGVSECFGIVLPENFKAPFFSKSIQEIWRRWHITLGTWLRDYIMNPILKSHAFISLGKKTKARFGKKQGKKIPTYLAMLILWGCNGLWHGNSWKYIVGVGFWFWLVIVLSQIMNPVFTSWKNALRINVQGLGWKAFQVIRTYILFSFGNLFFRAVSLRDAFSRVYNGFHIKMNFQFLYDMKAAVDFSKMGGKMGLLYMAVSLAAVLIVDYMIYKEIDVRTRLADKKWLVRWVLYYAMVILIVFSLDISNQESLYAQF